MSTYDLPEGYGVAAIDDPTPCEASPLADTIPPVAALPHGYASDADALRAIATLYREAAVDVEGAYYAVPLGGSLVGHLERREELWRGADLVVCAWARLSAPEESPCSRATAEAAILAAMDPAWDDDKWLAIVVADVAARLAGRMDRPLPTRPVGVPGQSCEPREEVLW